jgi:hypothetical protein
MNILVRSILIAPIALLVALPANAGMTPSAPRAVTRVRMAEANTSSADRNDYTKKARADLQAWRVKLDDFGASAKVDTKEARKVAADDLNKAWTKAHDASAKLETVGATDWESAKASFRKASDELAATWTKVEAEVK